MPIRKELLFYFQKRLRLDMATVVDQPNGTPVIVSIRTAFENVLAGTTK